MQTPFNGLSKFQINKLFELLKVHIYKYKRNQEIFSTLKNDNIIGIILEGSAQIKETDYNGDETVLETLSKDSLFDTNFSIISSNSYQIIAREETQVVVIDYYQLLKSENLKHNYFNIFLRNLFDIINYKFQKNNERIRILEKKQIREKLLTYFEIEYSKAPPLKSIYLPFSFKELSDYLAVNRSAMFRELKNLKEERLIEIKGNKITLLYK